VALRCLRMGKIDVITYKYVIRFVIDLRQVGGFLRFVPPIKLTATIRVWVCVCVCVLAWVCVCVCVCEANFVLFNSMLKYVINRLMHAFFHIRTLIIPKDRYRL
jgi:hypothetical protein